MAPRIGNRNFSTSESMNMLGIMSNILPIDGDDWLAVLAAHSVDFPGREVESLRRKFSMLHRKKIPAAGDPIFQCCCGYRFCLHCSNAMRKKSTTLTIKNRFRIHFPVFLWISFLLKYNYMVPTRSWHPETAPACAHSASDSFRLEQSGNCTRGPSSPRSPCVLPAPHKACRL
jgi:hypothetical protein